MPWLVSLFDWLARAALASLPLFVLGAAAVLCCRQPVRRIRVIELTLVGCLVAPWLGLIPGWPRWPVSWPAPSAVADSPEESPMVSAASSGSAPQHDRRPAHIADALPEIHAAEDSGGPELSSRGIQPATGSAVPDSTRVRPQVRPEQFDVRPWIATGGLLGFGGLAVWWIVGIVGLARLLRTARPVPASCDSALRDIAGPAGERVALVCSDRIEQPFACLGLRGRPLIVLPTTLCAGAPRDEQALRWSLAHEWSHVERGDLWAWVLAGLARVLFFYQPLAWWLRRQLRLHQDYIADARAAEQAGEPPDYAEFLTAQAFTSSCRIEAAGLGIGGGKSDLYRRVVMLVTNSSPIERRCGRLWSLSAIAAMLIALVAASGARSPLSAEEPAPEAAADTGISRGPAAAKADAGVTELTSEQPADGEAAPVDPPQQDSARAGAGVEPGTITIAGTCRDDREGDAGPPVSGCQVALYEVDYAAATQRPLKTIRTDDDGRFAFSDLPSLPDGPRRSAAYFVTVAATGRASGIVRIPHDGATDDLTVTLKPAASLRGRVTGPNGRPVAGALVSAGEILHPIEGVRSARTGENGEFKIADLSAWDARDSETFDEKTGVGHVVTACYFHVRHPDYARGRGAYSRIPSTVDVALEHAGLIEGWVVYGTTGEPASKVVVSAQGTVDGGWAQTVTDERGRYRLTSLRADKYNVWARQEGWTVQALDSFEIAAGQTRSAPDLQLTKGGIVRGRLIHARTGNPVRLGEGERTQIGLYGPSRPRSGAAIESTDVREDGSFEIRVAPGENYLYSCMPGPWDFRPRSQTVAVDEGETVEITFRVRRADEPEDPPPVRPRRQPPAAQPPDKVETEQQAIAQITRLGGWVKTDDGGHVVEVNMVYHYDEGGERFDNDQVTDEALRYLRHFPRLKLLALKNGQATDEGLEHLKGLTQLEKLYMWDADITDKGIEHLKSLTQLKYLHASDAGLTDKSLEHLGGLKQLEGLSMQKNRFTDEALKHAAELPNLESLVLDLGESKFTDLGLRHLKGHPKLEKLWLQHSDVTDFGLELLQELPNLREILVSGTLVTDAAIESLQELRPDISIRK